MWNYKVIQLKTENFQNQAKAIVNWKVNVTFGDRFKVQSLQYTVEEIELNNSVTLDNDWEECNQKCVWGETIKYN